MRRRIAPKALLAMTVVLAAGIIFSPAAAPDVGTEFVISAKADRQLRTLDATWHAATGQFLTVWSEHPSHTAGTGETHSGNDDIYGRLVGLDGAPAGGDFKISTGGSSKDFPQVENVGTTVNPAHQLSLVVWSDARDGGYDIWGQLIAPSGNTLQGANFKISGADGDFFPALAHGQVADVEGRFLVVWERETAAGESEVWGRFVRAETFTPGATPGDLIGSAFQISDSTTGFASAPSVAYDTVNRQFLVVWGDDRGGPPGEREIWGQILNSGGGDVGGNFAISQLAGLERAPVVVFHPEQVEYLVAWDRALSPAVPGDVLAQRVSSAGGLVGGRINVAVTGDEEGVGDIEVDRDTGSYVLPLTTGGLLTRERLEYQKIARDGTLVGGRQQVATDTSENKGPSVAVYGATPIGPGGGAAAVSEVLVAWRDARSAVDADRLLSQDIYGRMVERKADSDGDGLLDSWEINDYVDLNDNGVLDAGDLDFSGFPAADRPDPNHKDLYVEVDWMQVDDGDGVFNLPGEHTHAMVTPSPATTPTNTPLDAVITVFANAPVTNPDGTGGITLHVDVGQLGGGGPIAETVGVDFFAGFEAVKQANFDPRRERVFRYAVRKHEGSGRAEIWGNDFWWRYSTQVSQATGFMHELGHTLGLRHGGGDNSNWKPNYFSIMSYTHQLGGILSGGRIDYSRQDLPDLDESNLNENTTLGDGTDQTFFSAPSGAGWVQVGPNANTAGNVAINWDNDGTPGETGANVNNTDVNNFNASGTAGALSTPNDVLQGFNDWANIRYSFRSSPNYDYGRHVTIEELFNLTALENLWRANLGSPSLTVTKTGTASAIPGDLVTYTIRVENQGPGPARNVAVDDTWPAGLTFNGATIDGANASPAENVLNADGTRSLRWGFDPLPAGDAVSLVLRGTVDYPAVGASVTNAVEVRGQNGIGEPVDAIQSSAVTSILFPDMRVTKTATASVNAGEAITYRITYWNAGTYQATGVNVTDTLPAGVYYSAGLDLGAGPQPGTVTPNADGTTTLAWAVGTVGAAGDPSSGPFVIEYTARPGLLVAAGTRLANAVSLDFTDRNGNDYPAVTTSAATMVTEVPPSADPEGLGFWRNRDELWAAETLARIQATDTQFEGVDGSPADGVLAGTEVAAALRPGGNMAKVLEEQLLAVYFNLATRRINAGTGATSDTALRLGVTTVADAVSYARAVLLLPVTKYTRAFYSDATWLLDDINHGVGLVY